MKRLIACLISLSASLALCEPLNGLVTINDGLKIDNPENIQDDYIRLTLNIPSYSQANSIRVAIENWLGPNMVMVVSDSEIRVQAPRGSSLRVEFIAAVLGLEV